MASLIDSLKVKQDQLTKSLNVCTDEKAYDQINEELQSVSKTLILEQNREKARLEAEAKAAHKAAVDKYNADIKRINSQMKKADELDKDIFEMTHALYTAFMITYDLRYQAAADTDKLQITAKELGLEALNRSTILMCGTQPSVAGGPEDYFVEYVKQYDLAARHLKDAKKNKVLGVPERPGMDWFAKGHGEFFL